MKAENKYIFLLHILIIIKTTFKTITLPIYWYIIKTTIIYYYLLVINYFIKKLYFIVNTYVLY